MTGWANGFGASQIMTLEEFNTYKSGSGFIQGEDVLVIDEDHAYMYSGSAWVTSTKGNVNE